MAKGILIAAMDFSDVAEDEFHDWYDLEHIPERRRVPGFINAERWIDDKNPKLSIATYDLESIAAGWRKARIRAFPWCRAGPIKSRGSCR